MPFLVAEFSSNWFNWILVSHNGKLSLRTALPECQTETSKLKWDNSVWEKLGANGMHKLANEYETWIEQCGINYWPFSNYFCQPRRWMLGFGHSSPLGFSFSIVYCVGQLPIANRFSHSYPGAVLSQLGANSWHGQQKCAIQNLADPEKCEGAIGIGNWCQHECRAFLMRRIPITIPYLIYFTLFIRTI